MTIYLFDGTMDGLLTAVFEAFSLKEQPEELLTEGDALAPFLRTYLSGDDRRGEGTTGMGRNGEKADARGHETDIRELVV